jgi:hypothetical protein
MSYAVKREIPPRRNASMSYAVKREIPPRRKEKFSRQNAAMSYAVKREILRKLQPSLPLVIVVVNPNIPPVQPRLLLAIEDFLSLR